MGGSRNEHAKFPTPHVTGSTLETLVIKKQKNRRALRKNKTKRFEKKFKLVGVNAAGISSKLDSLNFLLKEVQPTVFFIEETKYRDSGKLKIENYHIFELVRQSKDGGGGLALGCLKELQPVWMREGDDLVEALSVEISLKSLKIRCCVAYGCQETDLVERKDAFWTFLDEEVSIANQRGSGFVLHFDGNLWAGSTIIPGDPRMQNRNGKLFQNFLERHPHLTVVNSLPLCEGLITRSRFRVLDFFCCLLTCSSVCDQDGN